MVAYLLLASLRCADMYKSKRGSGEPLRSDLLGPATAARLLQHGRMKDHGFGSRTHTHTRVAAPGQV